MLFCLLELQRLARESSSGEVSKLAKGALWILEDKVLSEEKENAKNAGKSLLYDYYVLSFSQVIT